MLGILRQNQYHVLALAILLVAELEVLLVSNYPIRTELRALFGLPLYHVLLTFATLAALVRWTSPKSLGLPGGVKVSLAWLAIHLAIYTTTWYSLESLWDFSKELSPLFSWLLWLVVGVSILASWLLAWLPFQRWRELRWLFSGWILWALPLSLVAPYIAEFTSNWWKTFANLTFVLSSIALSWFYPLMVTDPAQLVLGTPSFVVEIQPGCSGYEGMGLIAVLLAGYLWLKRGELRLPTSLAIIPLGMGIAYYANIVRLVLLIAIGTEFSPAIAMRGFHSQAGWISFTLLSLLLITICEKTHVLQKVKKEHTSETSYDSLPFLAPTISLLIGSMLVQAFSADFQYLYFLKPMITGLTLYYYYPKFKETLGRPCWAKSISCGLAVYFLWIWLTPVGEGRSPFQALSGGWACCWIAVRSLSAVAIVPLAEELTFRGYLLRRLQTPEFEKLSPASLTPLSVLLSSLCFGLLHTPVMPGFLAGLAYAWISARPGYLSNAVVAHATTNLCIALQALALGNWWLW